MTYSHRLSLLLGALALAGCSAGRMNFDTIPADSGWQPQGVNTINLQVMAAHPADLARGYGNPGALGTEAEPPVERLWTGRPKLLPASNISPEADSGNAQSQPPAGSGQAGSN